MAGEQGLRAGVGRTEITTERPTHGVHDPLYAKALVLDDGNKRVALVALDVVTLGLIGDVPDDFVAWLRQRIAEELDIPADHLLVNASHTHPPGRLLCEPDLLRTRVFEAVRQAKASLRPVRFGVGVGYEPRFIINRTLRLKDGRRWTIRQANPCPPDEQVASLGPLDPEIGVLRFDCLDGCPLAVVFIFGCHPLMGFNGGPITADFPGFAAQLIEETLGDKAMAIFLQGAGGDVCDVFYKDVHRPRDARIFGMMLGLSTLQAWRQIETKGARLNVISEIIRLPRRTDIPERLAALEEEQAALLASLRGLSLNFRAFLPLYLQYALNPEFPADYAYRYLQEQAIGRNDLRALEADNRARLEKYLQNIRAMERLAHIQDDIATLKKHAAFNEAASGAPFEAKLWALRIGEAAILACPMELLTEVALNIKRASPHRFTFIAGCSNGYAHYGPPANEYGLGGYEATECFLAPEWQAIFEEKAAEILKRL